MTETSKKLRLDAVLAAWPEVENSALEWEEMARSIDQRVNALELGHSGGNVSTEDLLIQPLGQIEGEGHNSAARVTPLETPRKEASKGTTMTMQPDRERDRRSLQDLAKLATTGMTAPPPSVSSDRVAAPFSSPSVVPSSPHSVSPSSSQSPKDDSGIVDLAMAAQSDPGAVARAQTTPLASGGLFDDEPPSVRPGPVSAPMSASAALQQPAPSVPPFSLPPASLPPASMPRISAAPSAPASVSSLEGGAHAALPKEKKKKGGVVLLFGAIVAAAAVAAGGFFFVKAQHAKASAAVAVAAANKPAPVVATTPDAPRADTVASNPTPSAPAEMDPNALPDPAKPAAPKPAGLPAKPAAVAMAAAPPPAATKDTSAKVSQKDLPAAPSGPTGDLGAAMKGAVGDKDQAQTPAAGSTGTQFAAGSVPQKPSQGAVTGALGAVLPSARACLGPDDAVSRASITFGSAGNVQSVNVTGGAAGKPAADCIKTALMSAKLAPFAEPTYTANVTVRH